MKINYKEACATFVANLYLKRFTICLLAVLSYNTLISCSVIDYKASTEVFYNKKYLNGKVIASEKPVGYQMCIRECVKRNCKSVNFNKEKLQCDLMSTNDGFLQNGDIFQADPDYIFVNLSDSENIEKKMALQSANLNEAHDDYVCTTIRSKIVCVLYNFRPRDCQDIYNTGLAVNGVYTIFPAGEVNATKAYCDMTIEPEGWTIFQRRMNGLTGFYRNWEDYKYGFGNPNNEYWLGNSYVHQLTKNRDCQLRIDLVNWDNLSRYAEYEQFRIGDENDGYRLSIGTYSGNAGQDSLKYHNGIEFTTRDRDNDKYTLNCAVIRTGAWWYKDCYESNLNGNYSIPPIGEKGGMVWTNYPSSKYMKETTMKLKCG